MFGGLCRACARPRAEVRCYFEERRCAARFAAASAGI